MIILLFIFAAILGIIVLLFFLSLMASNAYDVSRTIEISKPKSEVFEYLKYLEKQHEWSPWAKKDPNMKRKLTGTDGEVGAISYWNGNKDVGEGEQEITKIVEGESVEGELRFFKPWKSTSDFYFKTQTKSNDTTEVTWGFSGENKFPMRMMMLFVSMDKMVGKDFEEGLKTLKSILEN